MSGGLRPVAQGINRAGPDVTDRDWLRALNDGGVSAPGGVDVGKSREARRRRRLWWLAALLAVPLAFLT
ncbi:MAG: hypothetical protein ACXV5Q_13195 [Frankiaceae bacterium]